MKVQFFVILIFLLTYAAKAQVAVIANKSVKVENINKTELLDFYTGDVKKWEDGQKVYVFDLELKGKLKNDFYEFIGKSSSRMKSIWMKNMLSGDGDPPPAMKSESEMLKEVENTKGAIGFINYENVNKNVKVLKIIESNISKDKKWIDKDWTYFKMDLQWNLEMYE